MKYSEGTSTYEAISVIDTPRLTIKDVEGRVNYFDNATVRVVYLMGDKFYKVEHAKGVEYYNPRNVVFMSF